MEEKKKARPGLYFTFSKREPDIMAAIYREKEDPTPSQSMLLKDKYGVLLKSADGFYLSVTNN